MKTAIAILNWNGKDLLEKFLPSVILNSEQLASIYVIDNASTDDSVDFVAKNFPTVHIIKNAENGGYAKGYNDGLANIVADLFILLNNDVEVTPNWLAPIIYAFEADSNLGVAQPKLLDYSKKNHFEYAGAAGGFIDALGYPYCRGRIFETVEQDSGQYDDNAAIFWASGAVFAIRREVFYEAGKFDELYFAHQEEIDLCWRIKNLGYSIHYIGSSHVYHVGGATLDTMNPKKTFYNFRNSLFNLAKNTASNKIWLTILGRLILDGFAGIKFLAGGKSQHFLAILKAHYSFYCTLPHLLKSRKRLKQSTSYYHCKSIVWQYFVLKKKYFFDVK